MAQFIMDHSVSGCFGTRLAPFALTALFLSGEVHAQ